MSLALLRAAAITAFALLAGTGNVLTAETGGPWKLGDIVVEQAWARLAPGGARTGAVYLTVHNKSGQDDLLLAVDSPVAKSTAVQVTIVENDVARMEPLPAGVNLPSHGEVVMRPGGMHIMMTGVSADMKVGSLLPVKMVFRDAGSLDFEVPVVPLGAFDPAEQHLKH
ncbi:copper chaperone PCu(A)C [Aestuariivirga sp.]|uniref:copper chaperone PCu(A)C n=1 Tax=Aestuariivirga sp. TaxID=2650926 RepID=UPI003593982F